MMMRTARAMERGMSRPGIARVAGVEAGHLHAGEQQDDAAEEGQVRQLQIGHQSVAR